MRFGNTRQSYGVISVSLHWLMAILVIGLFPLGLYMTGLGYYDPWYQAAPALHRSFGLVMLTLLLLRLVWRFATPLPEPVGNDIPLLRRVAEWIHWSFYLLLFAIAGSGYLISTADGRGIEFFGWFTVPALIPGFDRMEDVAGEIHLVLAVVLMLLVALHTLAALKHHFIDRDTTLVRMLGMRKRITPNNSDFSKETI